MARKTPDEVKDYGFDYTAELATDDPDDTLSTSTWTLPTGLTLDSDSNTTTTVTAWISGGTLGTTYRVENTVTTVNGRTHDKHFNLEISLVRDGMGALITELRRMTDTESDTTTWPDEQLQNLLDQTVTVHKRILLDAKGDYSDGAWTYTDYLIPNALKWLEQSPTLKDSTGADAPSHTINYEQGRITFAADTANTIYYLSGQTYDLNLAASRVWRDKAALVAQQVDWSSDNHRVSASAKKTQYLEMADYYLKRGKSWRSRRITRTDAV